MYRSMIEGTRRARRVVFFLGMLCMPAVALGNAIVVGNHNLLPNQSGQVVNLYMTGTDAFSSSDLYLYINGGVAGAPVITHVFGDTGGSIPLPNLAGSIWGSLAGIAPDFPDGTASVGTGLQTQAGFATPGFFPIVASGLYVTLTFDTTGVAPGVYSFSLTGRPSSPTRMTLVDEEGDEHPVPLDITNGTLTVVPEPASLVLGAIGMLGISAYAWRRKRTS